MHTGEKKRLSLATDVGQTGHLHEEECILINTYHATQKSTPNGYQ